MAIKEIVKGLCPITRCKYDVYTKEKIDELVPGKITGKDYSEIVKPGIYLVDCHTMTDNMAEIPMPYKFADGILTVLGTSNQLYGSQCLDIGQIRFFREIFFDETGQINGVGKWKKATLTFEEINNE